MTVWVFLRSALVLEIWATHRFRQSLELASHVAYVFLNRCKGRVAGPTVNRILRTAYGNISLSGACAHKVPAERRASQGPQKYCKSCTGRAYSIKSYAYLILVRLQHAMSKPCPSHNPCFWNRTADSNAVLKRFGLMTPRSLFHAPLNCKKMGWK